MTHQNKMAYLIIVHKNDRQFRTLLRLLDDKRNDVFIHMDKKTQGYDKEEIESGFQHANCIHIERQSVSWGGYSQIETEVRLLEAAVEHGPYMFYHLLSGEDLPIKEQDTIYEFFLNNTGKEFVRVEKEHFEYADRIRYYYKLQEYARASLCARYLQSTDLLLQKLFRVRRNRNIRFQKGSNWFSITDSFANYIVAKKQWIKKVFRNTCCGDELFVQTLLVNSDYQRNLYYSKFDDNCWSTMRKIDWTRGSPYVFTKEDYEELMESPMLFARKFQWDKDSEIIKKLEAFVASNS